MGLFDTKSKTSSTQQSTSNTANNLWGDPNTQAAYGNYINQYSPSSISSVQAPANSFMYNAANYQTGLAPGLNGAMNVAGSVANNGLSTADIMKYYNPQVQNTVDKTIASYDNIDRQAFENMNSKRTGQGALGNNTGKRGEALYYQGNNPEREAKIAGLYSTAYQNAVNNAATNAGIQLQGAGAQGQLTGVQSNANNTGFNQGETIRQASLQNQLLPFQLNQQYAQGLGQWGNLAGTTSSGSSTGTNITRNSPSGFQIGSGFLGFGMGAAGGGFGGNLGANLGMIPYGSFASGGGVNISPYAPVNDNKPEDAITRMGRAMQTLGLGQGRASGGEVGDVPSLAEASGIQPFQQETQPPMGLGVSSPDTTRGASAIATTTPSGPAIPQLGGGPIAPAGGGMSMNAAPSADGGQDPSQGGGGGPGSPPTPESYQRSRMRDLGNALMASSGNLVLGPAGQQLGQVENSQAEIHFKNQQQRMDQWRAQLEAMRLANEAERAVAALTGEFRGQPTMAGQKLPGELAVQEAHTIEGQKKIKDFEQTNKRELDSVEAYRKEEQRINMYESNDIIDRATADRMRTLNRELYDRTRSNIQGVKTPAQTPMKTPSVVWERDASGKLIQRVAP